MLAESSWISLTSKLMSRKLIDFNQPILSKNAKKCSVGKISPYDDDHHIDTYQIITVVFVPNKKKTTTKKWWHFRVLIWKNGYPITLSNLIMKTDRTGYKTAKCGAKIFSNTLWEPNQTTDGQAARPPPPCHTQKPHGHRTVFGRTPFIHDTMHVPRWATIHHIPAKLGDLAALAPRHSISFCSLCHISQIWNIRSNPLIENSIMQWCRTKHKVQQQQQQEKHSSAGTLFIFFFIFFFSRNMHGEKNKQILCVSFR